MRGMILAAGRGIRMGELTQFTPKPLLKFRNYYLIEHAINQMKMAGIDEIVINTSYQGHLIEAALGSGSRYDVKLQYSYEKERLETGGGILQALNLLGPHPFVVVSADIVSDFPIQQLFLRESCLAHLVMVDNPSYNPAGDFGIVENYASRRANQSLTFGNIGIYHPALFAGVEAGYFKLFDLVYPAMDKKLVTAEHYTGEWRNIGTPEDLLA